MQARKGSHLLGAGWGAEPEGDVGGLHGLVDDGLELGADGVEIDLVAEAAAEGLDHPGGVVALAVEVPIHCPLDA